MLLQGAAPRPEPARSPLGLAPGRVGRAGDDGEEISKSEAGAFARYLLQEYYEVDDIVITDDQVQSDGSERLNWYSESLGVDGTSFFETRGTTFLLLTWVVDSAAYDQYFPVWDNLVSSYAIPEPE